MGTWLLLVLEIVFQALRYIVDYCKSWQRILDKDSFSFFCFSYFGFGIWWRVLVLRHLTDIIFFPLSKVLRNMAQKFGKWEKKIYIYIHICIYILTCILSYLVIHYFVKFAYYPLYFPLSSYCLSLFHKQVMCFWPIDFKSYLYFLVPI